MTFSWCWCISTNTHETASSATQGQSVKLGGKAPQKFSSIGGRAPGYRLSSDHFQTVKWMLAPDWAQKMLCIIVPNRRTASPEFFSWVRTRRLLSRHSCPVRSRSSPNQKRRNYRWVEKRFGCYQQEQFNLHWENSVSDGSQCIVNNRICWNFAITEAIMASTNSLKWFLKKTPGTEKHKDKIKNVMALLRCHCDSDCNKTQIIRNFHLYVIQLWEPFFHIFTHGIVINAQIWEVNPPQKNPVEPP